MCYYIGIEDLVANALIEIVERTQQSEVKLSDLNEYGAAVIRVLNKKGKEAVLLISRERTNAFIHDCTEFFSINDIENGETIITMREDIDTTVLRRHFRSSIAFNVLLAFINESSLKALGVK